MDTITPLPVAPALFQAMARYNRWQNGKLYAAAASLPDEARKADRGAYFGSVHATLDHIIFGDRAWMGRWLPGRYPKGTAGVLMFEDFAEMRSAREALDKDIIDWAAGLTEAWLGTTLTWTSGIDGRERNRPYWLVVQQMFNHQTHHRGQASTLLKQLGVDIGVTDLPWMDWP